MIFAFVYSTILQTQNISYGIFLPDCAGQMLIWQEQYFITFEKLILSINRELRMYRKSRHAEKSSGQQLRCSLQTDCFETEDAQCSEFAHSLKNIMMQSILALILFPFKFAQHNHERNHIFCYEKINPYQVLLWLIGVKHNLVTFSSQSCPQLIIEEFSCSVWI